MSLETGNSLDRDIFAYKQLLRYSWILSKHLAIVGALPICAFVSATPEEQFRNAMGQPPIPRTPSSFSLANKTVIVTGGNAGMGYEAARQFLILGASNLIIAVRSKSKGQEAVSALRADPAVSKANPSATVHFFELDLDDYKSALGFVNKVKTEVHELDVLLLNGGVNIMKYQASTSGHERVMQVNAYSNFFISLELLPLLRSTAQKRASPSHLTIVGSAVQHQHTLSKKGLASNESVFAHWDDQKKYSGMTRYGDSKVTVAAFVRELSKHVGASEVIVNDPCPGLVATGFDKHLPGWLKPIMALYRKISARTVEEGARTLVYASAVAGQETHGRFLQSNKVDPDAAYLEEPAGKEYSAKLWSEMLSETTKYDANISALYT